MKLIHTAPSNAALIASTRSHMISNNETMNVTRAHRLLLTDYKSMNRDELHEHLIQIESVMIRLMPYANRHKTLASMFINRLDEIDAMLMDIQNHSKSNPVTNDVSEQTDHGIIFN